MTISYTGQVATCRGLGCFWRLLFRWRGSIYKLLWQNLILYSILYFGLSITYRFYLDTEQRESFEKMSLHCQVYGDLIPVSFVLGFYVSLVIKRWWDQYLCMPWPDNLALFVSALVHGQDDRGRMMRRTIMRYVNLSLLLTLRMISPGVKKRFPTLEHAVEAGWMLPGEKKIFDDLEQKTLHAKYWMPLVWAGGVVTRGKKENRVKDDFALKTLIDELNNFRSGCGGMLNYDWISIPLVYTQVVTLAVYVFFLATLMGNQYLDPEKKYPKHEIDLVFPVFTFLQFFFYMGWLKVAESLVNPFGEDDDDFELNWLIDRNLQISYVIVDEMHQEHPEMLKDQYWDEIFPAELPYTAATKQYQTGPPLHSAEPLVVSSHDAEFVPMEPMQEDTDIDPENELEGAHGVNGEGSATKVRRLPVCHSSNASVTSRSASYSGGKRNSVLNMLSRIFHPHGNSNEIHRANSAGSLRTRRFLLHSASVSHSVAPSRCSFQPDLLFAGHEDRGGMFSMSSDFDLLENNSGKLTTVMRRSSSPCRPSHSPSPCNLMSPNMASPTSTATQSADPDGSVCRSSGQDGSERSHHEDERVCNTSDREQQQMCSFDSERRPSGLPELEPIAEHREESGLSPQLAICHTVSFGYLETPHPPASTVHHGNYLPDPRFK